MNLNSTGPCAHFILRVIPSGIHLVHRRLLSAGHVALVEEGGAA